MRLIVFMLVFLVFLAAFYFGKKNEKHDYIDVAWGLGFIVAAISSYFLSYNKTSVGFIVTILVLIWGIRLSYHLWIRNSNAKEDYRYVQYRENYKGNNFDLYFFFRMYLVQFVLNIFIAYPVIHMNISGIYKWNLFTILGILI